MNTTEINDWLCAGKRVRVELEGDGGTVRCVLDDRRVEVGWDSGVATIADAGDLRLVEPPR